MGQTRLLKNKENQRIRLLMRQEKTLKIRANHLGALRAVLTCCGRRVAAPLRWEQCEAQGAERTQAYGLQACSDMEACSRTRCKSFGVGGVQCCPGQSCRSTAAARRHGYTQRWTLPRRSRRWSSSACASGALRVRMPLHCAPAEAALLQELQVTRPAVRRGSGVQEAL